MKTTAAFSVAASVLLSTASAQQTYTIDPNSVSNATRAAWCTNQLTQCPLICLQPPSNSAETEANSCDPTTLTYACVCANGLSPNVSEYSQTLPYYICTEWGTQCVANCGSDNQCSSNCRSQHPCGAQNPTRVNTSTISKTMTGSATGSGSAGASTTGNGGQTVYTGFAGASSTGSGSSGAAAASASAGGAASIRAAALNAGQAFGLLGVVGAMVGGFAVLL